MKSVVITGASTGIGRACAIHLDKLGMRVFAGVRKSSDGDDLVKAAPRVQPIHIDVIDAGSIEKAAAEVADAAGEQGLWGLVNNAGISVQGPLEYLPVDELRRQFEVNDVGQIAVTQRFLPLIRKARGRIVFMSSIAGRSPSLPLIGPYSASKQALEALADALRIELKPWGIHVALVEPGSVATPIWDKGMGELDKLIESLPEEGRRRYEAQLRKGGRIADATGKRGVAPEKVAERVAHALTSKRPRTRYLVGAGAKARIVIEPLIPDKLRDRLASRVIGPPTSE